MTRISAKLRNKIIKSANNRCGYCQFPQDLIPIPFEIEHILPTAEGGTNDEENLWLACRFCNGFKLAKTHAVDPQTNAETRLFNPRTQIWNEHFEFSQDNTEILGKTACGRATILALKMNNARTVNARKLWVTVGWFPSKD
ncbi:MAG: HNH endonuclease [Pyrinomonadaceae bacterium]|nr:HNH endonuclease [Pyrinomonadaceae bacterium]